MKILFLTIIIVSLNSLNGQTIPRIRLKNDCATEIPSDALKEVFDLKNKDFLILDTSINIEEFLKKLNSNKFFQKELIENILINNSQKNFTLKEEETRCFLKTYLSLNNENWGDGKLLSLYYNIPTYNFKDLILSSLNIGVDQKVKELSDFKIFDEFNNDLANTLYKKSLMLQKIYRSSTFNEKSIANSRDFPKNTLLKNLILNDDDYKKEIEVKSLNNLLNKSKPVTNSGYKTWDEIVAIIEGKDLDIQKASSLLENYSALEALTTVAWPEEKKCSLLKKLTAPFSLYNYSSQKNKYIEAFYNIKLSCAQEILKAQDLYQVNSNKYFSKWCEDKKNIDKCMKNFTPEWLSSIQVCQNSLECTSVKLETNQTFYYSKKDVSKQKSIDFYTARAKYFSADTESIFFPLTDNAICKNNSCKPDLKYCDPILLFEYLLLQYNKSELNTCQINSDCSIKAFYPKTFKGVLYYPIKTAFIDYNDQAFEKIYDTAIMDCQIDLKNDYFKIEKIEEKYDLKKLNVKCRENKCELQYSSNQ